ncbi:molybdopterin-dependent oxidoreductase [Rhodoferax sp. U11-2br]|uniref:molybdopterin-dependent oxidoreductase n=1 Tax=Rhodoferax sp. U11-2br TaxID=2838878 RepID=UPI002036B135|nr:molybdopterin-dependent oxidoreductase [Rhodoferax sp. U11-2br]
MNLLRIFKQFTRSIPLVLGLMCLLGTLSCAQALEKPGDKVVLTLSGQISQVNEGKTAVFSLPMLSRLPQRTVFTKSPWYPAGAEFTGPLLRDVVRAVGGQGQTITAYALNDYKTEIPLEDALKYDVILARLMNGQPMAVRDKGPLFVVYPFDAVAELRTQVYYNRSAWQVNRLHIH